jgi:hypothetical protein
MTYRPEKPDPLWDWCLWAAVLVFLWPLAFSQFLWSLMRKR